MLLYMARQAQSASVVTGGCSGCVMARLHKCTCRDKQQTKALVRLLSSSGIAF